MKLELEFGTYYCYPKTFIINDIDADEEDFGKKYDDSPETAPEYGCGNMRFHPYEPREEILKKYNITLNEYEQICDKLEDGLSFGRCGWCA